MKYTALKSHSNGVYGLHYQLILKTHQRKALLTPRVRSRLAPLVEERIAAWEGELIELEIESDHIALSFSLPPTAALAEFVGALKTGTSRRLRNEFSGLRSKPRLWDTSYCVLSQNGFSPKAVDDYLDQVA